MSLSGKKKQYITYKGNKEEVIARATAMGKLPLEVTVEAPIRPKPTLQEKKLNIGNKIHGSSLYATQPEVEGKKDKKCKECWYEHQPGFHIRLNPEAPKPRLDRGKQIGKD